MKHAFAPHLAGRMLPALFSTMPFAKKPRFEGDPWAAFPHSAMWHLMHATGCDRFCTSRPIARAAWPADLDWLAMVPAAAHQPRPAAMQAVLFPEPVA